MGLLERGEHLAVLADAFSRAGDAGRLVLIGGEPGAGKSALVQEFCATHGDGVRVLSGRCDDLFAARPLGPLADIARARPGPLREALAAGDQSAIFDAFLAELSRSTDPAVVVLEDLQWADEATLDLLRFAARRLDVLSCLILATHRTDLAGHHPLRKAFGSLVGPLVTRLHLPPLSLDAVRTLAAGTGADPESLHARTGGNPFFVIELLAGQHGALPATVRETILARAAMLPGAARDALDGAAVLGREVPGHLIEAVGDCDVAAIDACVGAGMLVHRGGHLSFRHDLAREAIDEALTPLRRRQLHTRALAALGDEDDIVSRAHHAVGAGDGPAIVDLATRAADRCVSLGAYTEAATLYGRAVEHAGGLETDERCRLLEARARTCERLERVEEALSAGEELLGLLAATNDQAALGEWECFMSGIYRLCGRPGDARRAVSDAVARLEQIGESPALARALCSYSSHLMVSGEFPDAIAHARRAQVLAERFGLEEEAVSAMGTYGTSIGSIGDAASGIAVLHETLDRAKRAGFANEFCRSTANLAYLLLGSGQPAPALPLLDRGIAIAEEHELRLRRNCLLTNRAEVLIMLGQWNEALADLNAVLRDPGATAVTRCISLLQLGRVRARRGDPDASAPLEESLALALAAAEAQLIHPARMALAEAAWLKGDHRRAASEVEAAIPMAPLLEPASRRELALWSRRSGVAWTPEGVLAEPAAEILAGDVRAAADFWDRQGCRYEAADILADSSDVADLRRALEWLNALGGQPRAQHVTRRLRALGVRDLPRGPRPSTRSNPARLTRRELEVASLVASGLANAEIAERLVLSAKTVDHHVSAVLAKLGVPSRRQVAAAAADLGVSLNDAEQPA